MISARTSCVALTLALGGCSGAAPTPVDTGAKAVVREFCDAVLQRNWKQAHVLLDAESQARWSPAQFVRVGDAYRRQIGFEPTKVHIRSCDEQDDKAIARVAFGAGTSHSHQHFKDGLLLRKANDVWRISLPPSFGGKR